jgi:hypothetical protein
MRIRIRIHIRNHIWLWLAAMLPVRGAAAAVAVDGSR